MKHTLAKWLAIISPWLRESFQLLNYKNTTQFPLGNRSWTRDFYETYAWKLATRQDCWLAVISLWVRETFQIMHGENTTDCHIQGSKHCKNPKVSNTGKMYILIHLIKQGNDLCWDENMFFSLRLCC